VAVCKTIFLTAYSKADVNFLDQLNDAIYEHIENTDLDVEQLAKIMLMS
jgi:hypothetical protein